VFSVTPFRLFLSFPIRNEEKLRISRSWFDKEKRLNALSFRFIFVKCYSIKYAKMNKNSKL
jgi:hypothetical protein